MRLGRKKIAIESLQVAIEQNNVFPDCHRLLGMIFRTEGDVEKADEHEALAKQAEERLANFKQGFQLPRDTELALDIALDQAIGIGEIGDSRSFGMEECIVVVSGLPRSGTSMMMQVLQAGGLEILCDEKRQADASNPRGYFEFEPVKTLAKNLDWVNDAKGKALKVVTQLLPQLPRRMKYAIIYMARPLGEILSSQSKMLSRLDRKGASISDRQLAATYKKQVELVGDYLSQYEEVVAITVDYREALSDPIKMASQVNSLLGGILDESAMAAVVDPSLRNEKLSL